MLNSTALECINLNKRTARGTKPPPPLLHHPDNKGQSVRMMKQHGWAGKAFSSIKAFSLDGVKACNFSVWL